MAAIDSLLRLMETQRAQGLVVASDSVPCLIKADEEAELSMPALPESIVASFALDVVGPGRLDELGDEETITGTYTVDGGLVFEYEARAQGTGYRLQFQLISGPEKSPKIEVAQESAPPAITEQGRRDNPETGVDEPRANLDQALVEIIAAALDLGASDIFFSTGSPPRVRVDGKIEILGGPVIGREQIMSLEEAALFDQDLDARGTSDFALDIGMPDGTRRFRASVFCHANGLAAALRPINQRIPSLEELNLPLDLRKLCNYPNGLVLVTGPSGSGKSTTLAALVEHINQTLARHIITLEDPIEFKHSNVKSMVHQREIGRHVESFFDGLRSALRESPDVILVGEMRDLATIAAAMTAAETGHLVFSTLHTGDAVSAIDRVIDVFPGYQQTQIRFQLASVLRAVVTQVLVPSKQFSGRVPAVEKLVVTHAVAAHIREGRNHQTESLIQAGRDEGMTTLERSLAELVQSGRITVQNALRHARDVGNLNKLLR